MRSLGKLDLCFFGLWFLTAGEEEPGEVDRWRRRARGSCIFVFVIFVFFLFLALPGPVLDRFGDDFGGVNEGLGSLDERSYGKPPQRDPNHPYAAL